MDMDKNIKQNSVPQPVGQATEKILKVDIHHNKVKCRDYNWLIIKY